VPPALFFVVLEMKKDITLGKKIESLQRFLQDGKRIPVTCLVFEKETSLKTGDLVKVTGFSKGKGFAGVVKRWGFKGGPKTHGQSDRLRAPGSIGQTTTPGRVHKGKKMPGHMGNQKKTITGLVIMEVDEKGKKIVIKGLLPGYRGSNLFIEKYGEDKKFIPFMEKGQREIQETEEEKEERLRKEKEAQEKLKEAEAAEKEEKEGQPEEEKKEEKKEEKPETQKVKEEKKE